MKARRISRPPTFKSYWLGGFESSCHITHLGVRLDMLAATQHDRFVSDDYARLRTVRMQSVRDAVRWHRVEPSPGRYDFTSLEPYLDAAAARDVQVVWDLLHYGWPDGLDLFSREFVDRFAQYCAAVTRYLQGRSEDVPFFTPINELSFTAWAVAQVGWFHPFERGRGPEAKRQLVRAWIAGVDAIREVEPRARIVSVEPLIHTVPPRGRRDIGGRAAAQRASQWEAWDMLVGRREPELGGQPHYLDIVGVNFYHDNQWEVPGGKKIAWHIHPRDKRWMPLHTLLAEAYDRYQRPLIIGETSHVGVGRAAWVRELTDEVCLALKAGVPLVGVCLYPILDRFEWADPTHWHNSGLWDFVHEADGTFRRVLNEEYAQELNRCQLKVAKIFDANRESVTHADDIAPGRLLEIPGSDSSSAWPVED